VTLGLAMAYLGQRPLWQRVIMVLSCIPIALFCNAIRVTTTGCIHVFEYKSLASGTPHELLGLAMLPIALGLFALVGYVLRNLFVEAVEEP
jgi:exosortase/archaeosortase family protein